MHGMYIYIVYIDIVINRGYVLRCFVFAVLCFAILKPYLDTNNIYIYIYLCRPTSAWGATVGARDAQVPQPKRGVR